MAVLRDLSYAEPMSTYVPMNFQALDDLGKTLDQRYRTNEANLSTANSALKGLNVRNPYQPLVDEVVGTTRSKLDALSQRPDYENIGRELTKVVTEFDENDTVRAALRDKTAYDQYRETQTKRVGAKENGIRQTQYDRALALSENQNSTVEFDPVTGKPTTMFQGYNSVENKDISTDMMNLVKDWKESKKPLTWTDGKGNKHEYISTPKGYLRVGDQTYVDEKEVADALRMVVKTNPAYAELIKEEAMFKVNTISNGNPFDMDMFEQLGITDEELTKFLISQGIDPDKAKASPALLEGLAESILSSQIADGFILPAADKAGFTSIDTKYLTDNILMESIEASNRLKLEKYKQDRTDARDKTFDASLTISNEGVIIAKEIVPIEKILDNIKIKEAQLKQIERALTQNQQGGAGNYDELKEQQRLLQSELAVAKGTYEGKVMAYQETPDYNLNADKSYQSYLKEYKFQKGEEVGIPKLSKSEFMQELNKPYTSKDKKVPKVYMPQMWGGTTIDEINRRKTYIQNKIIDQARSFQDNVNKKSVDPNAPKGQTFNILDEPDMGQKSGTIRKVNELIGRHMIENGGEYQMAETGQPFDEILEHLYKTFPEVKKGDIKIQSTITDGELASGFPHMINVIDSKTGKKLLPQQYVLPSSGGSEERLKVGEYLMNVSKPNTPSYEQGLHMAASATYPQLSKTKLTPQLAAITDKSKVDTKPAVSALIKIGSGEYRIIKKRHTYKDENGLPLGTNTVYQLAEDGNNTMVDRDRNLNLGDATDFILNPTVSEDSPIEERILFRSVDDIQRAVYLQTRKN